MVYRVNYKDKERFVHWKKRLELLKKFGKGGKLLDIGCSSGYFIKYAKDNYDCYGIDIDKEKLLTAKEMCKNVALCDAQNLCFKEKFDTIVMFDVIEHVEDQERVLDNIRNIADDLIIMSIPITNGAGWVAHRIIKHFIDSSHRYLTPYKTLLNKIRDRFEIVEELNETFPIKAYFRDMDHLAFNKILVCKIAEK